MSTHTTVTNTGHPHIIMTEFSLLPMHAIAPYIVKGRGKCTSKGRVKVCHLR